MLQKCDADSRTINNFRGFKLSVRTNKSISIIKIIEDVKGINSYFFQLFWL